MKKMSTRHIASACLCLLLAVFLAACSAGSSEFVRILPTDKQPVAQLFEETNALVASWPEFVPNFNCADANQHVISHNFKIRPDLQKQWPVHVVVTVNLKEELLVVQLGHPNTPETMTPEVKELFEELVRRLQNKFGEARVVKLDVYNGQSDDGKLLSRLYRGTTDENAHYSCSGPK